jgi:hypothetical protein
MSIRLPLFFLVICGVFFGQFAQAHPFGSEIFAHRIRVSISNEQLHIDYMIEIPTRQLNFEIKAGEIEQQTLFQAKKIEHLLSGLSVRANSDLIELQSVDLGENHVRARPHSFLYEMHLQSALPKGTTQLAVNNQNYLNERAYFRIDLSLSDGLELQKSSLHKKREGLAFLDRTGRWWMDESLREFNLVFAPKTKLFQKRKTALISGGVFAGIFAGLFLRKRHYAKKAS